MKFRKILFGVTGGIGSGKSTVCTFLKEKNLPVLEADPLARQLIESNPQIHRQLSNRFGEEIYSSAGRLNKQRMRKLVFSNPKSREQINQIIHPHVLDYIQQEANRLFTEKKHPLIGVEAALIFESGMMNILDVIVVVNAPLQQRIDWVCRRDSLSRDDVMARIEAQLPMADKVRQADYVVENSGSLEVLRQKTGELHDWLLCKVKP